MKKISNLLVLIFNIFIFFGLSSLLVIVFKNIIGINITSENDLHIVLIDFLTSFFTVIILILCHFKLLKKDLKKITNKKEFFEKVIISFLILFVVKIIGSELSVWLMNLFNVPEETVDNQALIERLMGSAPILMIISICIFAPLEEEILFRGAIRKVIKNKKVFITVSGLIFGLMHVADSVTLFLEILLAGIIVSEILVNNKIKNKKALSAVALVLIIIVFLGIYYIQYGNLITLVKGFDLKEVFGSIVYISMGFCLAYLYAKDDNIFLTISVHALNNILSVIVILFLR